MDNTSGQLKPEGWLCIVFVCICIRLLMRRHHFIGSFAGEASFYWLSERGGTILNGKIGRRWVKIFIDVQNYGAGWLEFYFMVYALCLKGWLSRLNYFMEYCKILT